MMSSRVTLQLTLFTWPVTMQALRIPAKSGRSTKTKLTLTRESDCDTYHTEYNGIETPENSEANMGNSRSAFFIKDQKPCKSFFDNGKPHGRFSLLQSKTKSTSNHKKLTGNTKRSIVRFNGETWKGA